MKISMRKFNAILAAAMLILFLIHAIMGTMTMLGVSSTSLKFFAWALVGVIVLHIVVTTILTIQTLYARKKSGVGYFRENLLFWARRISGFAIIPPMIMHLLIFKASNSGAYRLSVFTTGRLISQILLLIAIAVHIITNVKPALIAFGIKGLKEFAVDILIIISILLIIFGMAFIVYYIRWHAV